MEPTKDMSSISELPSHDEAGKNKKGGLVHSVRRRLAAVGLGVTLLGGIGGDVNAQGSEPSRAPLPVATDVQNPKESPTPTLSIEEIPLNPETVSKGKFENFLALGPDKGFFLTNQYPTIVASEPNPETNSMWVTATLDGEKLTRESSGRFLSRGIYIDAYKYAGLTIDYQFDENTVVYKRETDDPQSKLIEVGKGPDFISSQVGLGSTLKSIITTAEAGTKLNIAPDKLAMNKTTFDLINDSLGTANVRENRAFKLYAPMIEIDSK